MGNSRGWKAAVLTAGAGATRIPSGESSGYNDHRALQSRALQSLGKMVGLYDETAWTRVLGFHCDAVVVRRQLHRRQSTGLPVGRTVRLSRFLLREPASGHPQVASNEYHAGLDLHPAERGRSADWDRKVSRERATVAAERRESRPETL